MIEATPGSSKDHESKLLNGNEFARLFSPSEGPSVPIREARRISELIDQGLDTIYLCYHGEGRSPESALDTIAFHNIPAISMLGGFEHLQLLKLANPTEYEETLKAIAKAPNVVVLLDKTDLDIYPNLAPLIEDLREASEAQGHKFYSDTYPEKERTYLQYNAELVKRSKRKN